MSSIPSGARRLVKDRERIRCANCGGPGSQWHHRRSRRVEGEHQHCPCNGIWLCHDCHRDFHDHPSDAMERGYIVSATETYPWRVPTLRFGQWWAQNCIGAAIHLSQDSVSIVDGVPEVKLQVLVSAGLLTAIDSGAEM